MIRTKRVYEPPSPGDGRRVLIDRLWPRGLTKRRACVDDWRRDLAPSDTLRTWFGHDPKKFDRFRERYRDELLLQRDALTALARVATQEGLTIVYAAKDAEHSNAVVLKELLEELRAGDGNARQRPRPRRGTSPSRKTA